MNKPFKTWLFWVCLFAALLGPLVVGAINHIIDSQFSTEGLAAIAVRPTEAPQTVCIPNLDQAAYEQLDRLALSQENDITISLRMAELFAADQAARQLPAARFLPGSDPLKLDSEDTARRVEVLEYILKGQIHTPRDLVYAAFIFQHGDCSEHYQFANRLAQMAMDAGYEDARWIYAATLDRYLMSIGAPQKFGTQYTWVNGEYQLYPVDPATTDAERELYDVPPLSEIRKTKPAEPGAGNVVRAKHWLESWWLTLIGSGFAILGAVICVVKAKANPLLGKAVLIMTLVIYVLSVIGHYAQVHALVQGTFEAQQKVWGGINMLMLAAWFIFGGIGAFRWVAWQRERKAG